MRTVAGFSKLLKAAQVLGIFICVGVGLSLCLFTGLANDGPQSIVDLINHGRFSEAQTKLKRMIEADPNSVVAYQLLGLLYQRERKFGQADGALGRAVQLSHGRDAQILFALCQTKFALKEVREALRLAGQISELAPNDPRTHYAIGRMLRENSLAEEGVQELEKARALAPKNPAILTELILANSDLGRVDQVGSLLQQFLRSSSYEGLVQAGSRFAEAGQGKLAITTFQRAVETHPGAYDAEFDLAFAYYNEGNPAKALETLGHISSSESDINSDYHYLQARVELALHHEQEAGREFLAAVKMEPDNEALCADAGLLFYRFENFWTALEIFHSCAERLPDSIPIETGLGLAYFHLGKYPEAIDTFRKVLVIQPTADAAREALAFILYITAKPREAHEVLEQRIGAPDADCFIYYLHALALLREGRQANRTIALQSLAEALKRNPKFPPAFYERGRIEMEAGNLSRALGDLETAARLDPSYAQPYAMMAQVYYRLGKPLEAAQAQTKYMALNHEREEKEQEHQLEEQLFATLR